MNQLTWARGEVASHPWRVSVILFCSAFALVAAFLIGFDRSLHLSFPKPLQTTTTQPSPKLSSAQGKPESASGPTTPAPARRAAGAQPPLHGGPTERPAPAPSAAPAPEQPAAAPTRAGGPLKTTPAKPTKAPVAAEPEPTPEQPHRGCSYSGGLTLPANPDGSCPPDPRPKEPKG